MNDDLEWQTDAKCRSGKWDRNLWLAEGRTRQARDDRAYAKAICNTLCPAREACLAHALSFEQHSHHYRAAVYGGLTGTERADLAREGTCGMNSPRNGPPKGSETGRREGGEMAPHGILGTQMKAAPKVASTTPGASTQADLYRRSN